MRLTELSLKNPAAIASAALVISLFGSLALIHLPIQLLPDTRQPQLWVNAEWREAAPNEVEEALVEPIEETMKGLPGLVEMRSESNRGGGGVGLTFEVGTDMTRVMAVVEAHARRDPAQYMWVWRRFGRLPPGYPDIYRR